MPRLIDRETRVGSVAAAVNELLAEGGIPALTMRSVATRVRVSPSSLHQLFGGRDRMLRLAAWHTSEARRARIQDRIPDEGALAFLPNDDDDIVDCRIWLAWRELGRSADWLEPSMTEAIEHELWLMNRAFNLLLARPDLEWLEALVDGLSVAVCKPAQPMRRDRARELLAIEAARIRGRAA